MKTAPIKKRRHALHRSSIFWTAIVMTGTFIAGCSTMQSQKSDAMASVRTIDEVRADAARRPLLASERPIVGLALGGGGLRGYAHVGVLEALEEAGIDVGIVVGTSAGAVIGSAYASGRSVADLKQIAGSLKVSSLTDWRLSMVSLMRGDAMTQWVSSMTNGVPIESMPRRFGAVATGIDTGESVLIDRGDAGLAIRASAAVPGAMQPVASAIGPLVDGGVSSVVPVRFTRAMGADIVVGVDIYCHSPRHNGTSLFSTIAKVSQTQTCLVSQAEMAEADILIAPSVVVDDMKDATQRDRAIQAGYLAMKEALPRLFALAGKDAKERDKMVATFQPTQE
ncbi:patatin-like phospholipase family protein [Zestomonas carbonaria]|uniref:PNPLA domain-containing protein n=1 Tax=Zestomonas carbonaria TaxID=2762745 RepID=A0A7U7I7I1_9GAMM|nr:patatin-like phospholipase family protein [Pseudomonas carbonaria]CAD5106121.1 hypothetical protein PSEWESI4_00381 [Pseudomonas carbonaria]